MSGWVEEATNDRLQQNKARPCSASQAVGNSCRVRNIRCIETGGSRHRERLMRYRGDDDEDGYDDMMMVVMMRIMMVIVIVM